LRRKVKINQKNSEITETTNGETSEFYIFLVVVLLLVIGGLVGYIVQKSKKDKEREDNKPLNADTNVNLASLNN